MLLQINLSDWYCLSLAQGAIRKMATRRTFLQRKDVGLACQAQRIGLHLNESNYCKDVNVTLLHAAFKFLSTAPLYKFDHI